MTYKQAKKIIASEEVVSIDEYAEAVMIIRAKEENKKKKSADPRKAHREWLLRNKERTDLKNEIRKYWRNSS
jgi:hypothetical protein